MNAKTWWLAAALLGLLVGGVSAQSRYEEDSERDSADAAPAYEGIWFTERQMELFVHRITDDMSERYGFDEEQLYLTREVIKDRFIPFLKEQRRAMQPLLNEFIEAQLGDEAPGIDHVADWAQRLLPVMDGFNEVVAGLSDDMGEYLSEEQVQTLEVELAGFTAGWQMVTNKVEVWADGGYDPYTEWPRSPGHNPEVAQQQEDQFDDAVEAAKEQAAADAKEGKITEVAKDAWARYVEEFARRYKFTDEQKQRAYRILDSIRQKRDQYLVANMPEMERIEAEFEKAETEEDREQAKAALEKLNARVERLFEKLKKELRKLPTRRQRSEAHKADETRRAAEDEKRKAALRAKRGKTEGSEPADEPNP